MQTIPANQQISSISEIEPTHESMRREERARILVSCDVFPIEGAYADGVGRERLITFLENCAFVTAPVDAGYNSPTGKSRYLGTVLCNPSQGRASNVTPPVHHPHNDPLIYGNVKGNGLGGIWRQYIEKSDPKPPKSTAIYHASETYSPELSGLLDSGEVTDTLASYSLLGSKFHLDTVIGVLTPKELPDSNGHIRRTSEILKTELARHKINPQFIVRVLTDPCTLADLVAVAFPSVNKNTHLAWHDSFRQERFDEISERIDQRIATLKLASYYWQELDRKKRESLDYDYPQYLDTEAIERHRENCIALASIGAQGSGTIHSQNVGYHGTWIDPVNIFDSVRKSDPINKELTFKRVLDTMIAYENLLLLHIIHNTKLDQTYLDFYGQCFSSINPSLYPANPTSSVDVIARAAWRSANGGNVMRNYEALGNHLG